VANVPLRPTDELKSFGLSLGFDTIGVCESHAKTHLEAYNNWLDRGFHGQMEYMLRHLPLKSDPNHVLEGVQSIIAVTLNYHQSVDRTEDEPHISEYALGRDYHKVLKKKLDRLGHWIQAQEPTAKFRACVDSAPILEREYAHLAGLGWFGKNTCLIDSKRGSRFFIGLLLTDLKFATDHPAIGGCGTCLRCVKACPTGAIVHVDGQWQVDSRSCISYLTIEHRGSISEPQASQIGDWLYGCDVCQSVCPFNEARDSQPLRGASTLEPDFLLRKQWPKTVDIPLLTREEWDKLTQGSAMRRTGYDGIRRNAEIVLRNQAKQTSRQT